MERCSAAGTGMGNVSFGPSAKDTAATCSSAVLRSDVGEAATSCMLPHTANSSVLPISGRPTTWQNMQGCRHVAPLWPRKSPKNDKSPVGKRCTSRSDPLTLTPLSNRACRSPIHGPAHSVRSHYLFVRSHYLLLSSLSQVSSFICQVSLFTSQLTQSGPIIYHFVEVGVGVRCAGHG